VARGRVVLLKVRGGHPPSALHRQASWLSALIRKLDAVYVATLEEVPVYGVAICRQCGWSPARVTAHGHRHTFATTALETCLLPVRHVQQALGHSSVATTETYLHDDRFAATINDSVITELLSTSS
jgi:integrase